MDPVKLVNDFILRLKFRHRSCLGKNFKKKKRSKLHALFVGDYRILGNGIKREK